MHIRLYNLFQYLINTKINKQMLVQMLTSSYILFSKNVLNIFIRFILFNAMYIIPTFSASYCNVNMSFVHHGFSLSFESNPTGSVSKYQVFHEKSSIFITMQ